MSETLRRKPWNQNEEKPNENDVELRVIGAGLPRTGTTSLKAALEILGFGPCHHMIELFKKPNRTVKFIRAYDGEKVDFHELMKGYGSTLDIPTADFYKEIHQVYPQAKIILTVRDSGEKWFESYQNTIGLVSGNKFHYFCIYLIRFVRLISDMGHKSKKKWLSEYSEIGPSMHDQHNRRVINENKESDLLVFNVKEGWAPLCKFLEVDIPQNIPFPNVNDTQQFNRRSAFGKIIGLCAWAVVGGLFALSIYGIMRMM